MKRGNPSANSAILSIDFLLCWLVDQIHDHSITLHHGHY